MMAACLSSPRVHASPLTWLWASPQPNGNNWVDLIQTNGFYVGLGGRGQLSSSMDLRLWTPHASGTPLALRSAAFFGDRVIITTEQGHILRAAASTNGLGDFDLIDLGTLDWLEGVASSGSQIMAVGDNAAIYTSTNGVNWTRQSPGFTHWLRSVAWANNRYVAVGESGLIATSPNGINWTKRSSGTAQNLNRVAWVVDRFWAVGDAGTVLNSEDGASWSPIKSGATNDLYAVSGDGLVRIVAGDQELHLGRKNSQQSNNYSWSNQLAGSNAPPSWLYYASIFDGTRYLLTGQTGMIVQGEPATDGLSWSQLSDSIYAWLWDLVALDDLLVTVGDRGAIATSQDGAHWDFESVPVSLTNTVFLGVAGDQEMLVAVGSRGSIAVSPASLTNIVFTNSVGNVVTQAVSTLGIVWDAVASPSTNDLQGVCLANGRWIVAGGAGTLLSSPNGFDWTPQESPVSVFLSSVTAWPGGWVIVGDQGTILTSPNGLSWLPAASGATHWLYRVRFLRDRLIAVGENGAILVSTNGISWNKALTPTVRWLNDVAWFGGRFYAAGSRGTLLSSEDALVWTTEELPTAKSLYALAPFHWQMIAVGIEGIVLRSQTAPVQLLDFDPGEDAHNFLFSGPPGQWFAFGQSDDLQSWIETRSLQFEDNTGLIITRVPPTPGKSQEFYMPR